MAVNMVVKRAHPGKDNETAAYLETNGSWRSNAKIASSRPGCRGAPAEPVSAAVTILFACALTIILLRYTEFLSLARAISDVRSQQRVIWAISDVRSQQISFWSISDVRSQS